MIDCLFQQLDMVPLQFVQCLPLFENMTKYVKWCMSHDYNHGNHNSLRIVYSFVITSSGAMLSFRMVIFGHNPLALI